MKVFFDNCTSPVLAATLHGFIAQSGDEAVHIRDLVGLQGGRSAPDVVWIDYLRQHPAEWIFISADDRIRKNPAERQALRNAGLHGFIMARGFQKQGLDKRAAALILRWSDIKRITSIVMRPAMHEIPVGTGAKLKQLPF